MHLCPTKYQGKEKNSLFKGQKVKKLSFLQQPFDMGNFSSSLISLSTYLEKVIVKMFSMDRGRRHHHRHSACSRSVGWVVSVS